MTTKLMAGIDLHSNNLFCAIVDMNGKRVFEKKLPCDLESVLQALKPFKKRLEKVAVESTYNWYWLVDGLQDDGYPVVLANPAAMQQYDGLKHADDKSDGFFLAEMLRLDILPTGHICDRQVRPVRDLLRRRMGLVHKRTSLILSLKSLHTRMTGRDLGTGRIKAMEPAEAEKLEITLERIRGVVGGADVAEHDHPQHGQRFSLLQCDDPIARPLGRRLDVRRIFAHRALQHNLEHQLAERVLVYFFPIVQDLVVAGQLDRQRGSRMVKIELGMHDLLGR